MSLTEISIKKADEIINLYSSLLLGRKGKLSLSQLQGYTINDISNSLKLMTAYRVYLEKEKIKKLKELAAEDNAAIMHFHLAFFDEQFQKAKSNIAGKVDVLNLDSVKDTYDDETVDSFLDYCLRIGRGNHDYWELIYSRIGLRYDIHDTYLQGYFKNPAYDQKKKVALLECLLCINAGLKWIGQKDYEKAYDEFNKAIQLYNFNADAYYYKGYIEYLVKEDAHAIGSFNKAIELDSAHAEAYYHRGVLNMDADKKEQGVIDLKKAESLGIKKAKEILREYKIK